VVVIPEVKPHPVPIARRETVPVRDIQVLEGALVVVKSDPVLNCGLGLLKRLEVVLLYALFLEGAEEALDHPVLLRRVGSDELLTQPVLLAARREMLGGEHFTVVAAQHRSCLSSWEHQPVTQQTRLLQGLLGILSPPSLAHMKSYDLAVVTVDHRRNPEPSLLCAISARHIDRPTLAWLLAFGHGLLHARSGRVAPVVNLPSVLAHQALDTLLVDHESVLMTQPRPDTPVSPGRMRQDHRPHLLHHQHLIVQRWPQLDDLAQVVGLRLRTLFLFNRFGCLLPDSRAVEFSAHTWRWVASGNSWLTCPKSSPALKGASPATF
jgi:hypothetical protein